ncbi:M20/M25/M40 family metallo-hydrolase [Microbacterium oxydans]|uniref:M20/M25/M40 family metallo-hydrolase n=1 Tax=Microbacterium oxydans TaxID=82380 RepID=UPI003639D2F0
MTDGYPEAFADDAARWLEQKLIEWMRIPSVSGDESRAPALDASAEWLSRLLRDTGFSEVEVARAGGAPAVMAEWRSADANAPTVLLYGHHDVQPATTGEWGASAFAPVVRDGRVHGRGAVDDKGQVLMAIRAVRDAARSGTGLATNVKVLVEGEEESGSPTLAPLLERHARRLACDAAVVIDAGMPAPDRPTISIGCRGMLVTQVDIVTADQDLHSGDVGGAVLNPVVEMSELIARLYDHGRRITVPGFYDSVRTTFSHGAPPIPLPEASGATLVGEEGWTDEERVRTRPSLDVTGLWSGYSGPGYSSAIPRSAHARLVFRLVPDQKPHAVFVAVSEALRARVHPAATVSVTKLVEIDPHVADPGHPLVQRLKDALEAEYSAAVTFSREGGSGPDAVLARMLAVPTVAFGIALPQDGWHSENESVAIAQLVTGAAALRRFVGGDRSPESSVGRVPWS